MIPHHRQQQLLILKDILYFHEKSLAAINAGVDPVEIFKLEVREQIARAKYIPQEELEKISQIRKTIDEQINQLQAVKA